ncbi:hypothetical protein B0H15DRAFT_50056 [Mycena belliarum]|uniref:Uncharacterized protein n=1 Tax=Mycena belliarum TaxID=1033014 RepID=A0AAD6XUF1_9AGAR|nr:hypothetical protein B0H15DRAFT_50056 [Mycena belliae]
MRRSAERGPGCDKVDPSVVLLNVNDTPPALRLPLLPLPFRFLHSFIGCSSASLHLCPSSFTFPPTPLALLSSAPFLARASRPCSSRSCSSSFSSPSPGPASHCSAILPLPTRHSAFPAYVHPALLLTLLLHLHSRSILHPALARHPCAHPSPLRSRSSSSISPFSPRLHRPVPEAPFATLPRLPSSRAPSVPHATLSSTTAALMRRALRTRSGVFHTHRAPPPPPHPRSSHVLPLPIHQYAACPAVLARASPLPARRPIFHSRSLHLLGRTPSPHFSASAPSPVALLYLPSIHYSPRRVPETDTRSIGNGTHS